MIRRWLQWEFWPFWFFYIPIYLYWLWLALRARSLLFFSAANPLMELGGLMRYSKFEVLKRISPELCPKMQLLQPPFKEEVTLSFPLVAKPDKGERGRKVTKVDTPEELHRYLEAAREDIILQEMINLSLEFGVMYSRMPDAEKGKITSLMQREFLEVEGDGKHTVVELLTQDARKSRYVEKVQLHYPQKAQFVPAAGERCIIEPIGNHNRGTTFRDLNDQITPKLEASFDKISRPIEGFHFGRYDVKAASFADLEAGNIQVIELNGANSEPAHIYEPGFSIWKAYGVLFRHWTRLFKVSRANHRRGVPYGSLREGIAHTRARWRKK
ncbi:MAG: D-alanine--D-alanine ligase [Bacteroidota bacterium]